MEEGLPLYEKLAVWVKIFRLDFIPYYKQYFLNSNLLSHIIIYQISATIT